MYIFHWTDILFHFESNRPHTDSHCTIIYCKVHILSCRPSGDTPCCCCCGCAINQAPATHLTRSCIHWNFIIKLQLHISPDPVFTGISSSSSSYTSHRILYLLELIHRLSVVCCSCRLYTSTQNTALMTRQCRGTMAWQCSSFSSK